MLSCLPSLKETTSRELARGRIHVERLIGMVKQKFTILEGILPVAFIKNEGESDLTMSDKLVVICQSYCTKRLVY